MCKDCACTMDLNDEKQLSHRNKVIEEELEEQKRHDRKVIKLLLLGGSESGKSTFAKQLKIIKLNGFSEDEMEYFRQFIYLNIVEALKCLLGGMQSLDLMKEVGPIQNEIQRFKTIEKQQKTNHVMSFDSDVGAVVNTIWKNTVAKKAYERRCEFYMPDSAKYFLDNVDRISDDNYKPTEADIIRCRIVTTGITELQFNYKKFLFRLIDVGGQRTERRKWIHCFDNVTAILFVAALSEYDQLLNEDNQTNRMHDSLILFENISHNQYFKTTSIMLFFNKKDIFMEKLQRSSLKQYFPDYTGNNTYEDASAHIRQLFLDKKPPQKDVYTHFTNATDTSNVDYVFEVSLDIIIRRNMAAAGLS